MSHDDFFYDDLPEDPEQAFLYLKSKFRAECDRELNNPMTNNMMVETIYNKYISQVSAAITEIDLDCELKVLQSVNSSSIYPQYMEFRRGVDKYRTMLAIRHSRHRKEYTVALDQPTKMKLRHLLSQIKEAVDKLDVSPTKKEALFAKIGALENEINRDRTRFDVVAALWIEGCEAFGDGVEKLEPLRKWVDLIGNLLGKAKVEEDSATRRLPPPETQKQIERPKAEKD